MASFRDDRRAVTVQIGAILLFGFLVIALSLYQATVVPAQNKQVEFKHSQRVQNDMLSLRSGVVGAAGTGTVQPVTVELGTTYPGRVLFVNPPPPAGTIRTGSLRSVAVANVTATNPETRDFLNGTYDNASRRALVYAPTYNVYQRAPTTVVEGSVLVNRFDSGNATPASGQALVDGRTIRLVTVRGNLSTARSGGVAVDPDAVSTGSVTRVRNTSAGPPTVTVPTSLTADQWRTLLVDEPRVRSVGPAGGDAVEITLEPVEPGEAPYELRVGVVTVGTGGPDPAATYLTSPDAPGVTLRPGDTVTVEVRDEFNNPVARGVNVTRGASLIEPDDDATPTVYEPADGDDGVFEFEYVGGDGTLNATINGTGTSARTNVSIAVTEAAGGGGGGGADAEYLLRESFEQASWAATGWTRSDADQGLSTGTETFSDGSQSATIGENTNNFIYSPGVDTSDAGHVELEYWIQEGPTDGSVDDPDPPTAGPGAYDDEYILIEYRAVNGSWVETERIIPTEVSPASDGFAIQFHRHSLIPDDDALHSNFAVRFRQPDTTAADRWYVDDVRIIGVGSPASGGGGGGGTGSAGQVELVSGSGTAADTVGGGDDETVRFTLRNTGGGDVTATAFAVNSTSSSADRVRFPGNDRVSTDQPGGVIDSDITIGGMSETFNPDATLPGGSDTELTVRRFQDGSVMGPPTDVDMTGETVTVTVFYSDGSSETYSFTAS